MDYNYKFGDENIIQKRKKGTWKDLANERINKRMNKQKNK